MYVIYLSYIFCRKLLDEIIKVVTSSNFSTVCLVLESNADLVERVVLFYSVMSSIKTMTSEEINHGTLIQALTNHKFLTETDNRNISKHGLFSKPNIKQNLIDILSSKPLTAFADFLTYLDSESLHLLQFKIEQQRGEIRNAFSYTRSTSTNTLAASSLSSDRVSTQYGNGMHKSKSTPLGLKSSCSVSEAELTRSISFPLCTDPDYLSNSLTSQEPSALENYKQYLKLAHKELPILSKQGRTGTSSDAKDHFINVTVIKSLQQVGQNTEYNTSTNAILDHEIQYIPKVYKIYDEMFEGIDSKSHQLVLLEGDAGTGKTTLAYKVCKEWAEGNALSEYSHVILLQLRDIKPDTINKPEELFIKKNKYEQVRIYSEIDPTHGIHVLFWLEGWDELDNSLKFHSVFTDLISGQLFPLATVVVSTRPSATGSLKEFASNLTYKFKLIGFTPNQVEEYIQHYCVNEPKLEKFMDQLKIIPSLAQLTGVPLNLSILLKLLRKTNKDLPNTFTEIFHDYLMNTLQYYKCKNSPQSRRLLYSTTNLPPEMQKIFDVVAKYAFEYIFHHKPISEEEISEELFNSFDVPWGFDGLGFFKIESCEKVTGETTNYTFYKPIQELLAAIYLTTLKSDEQLAELKEIFGNSAYEMVWMFYAGITRMKLVTIDKILEKFEFNASQQQLIAQLPANTLKDLVTAWQQCHYYFTFMITSDEFSADFLLTLILCCYEAKNEEACKVIAANAYPDYLCRIEIPPSRVSPYLLLAVSYFISHSCKMWSLRCDASLHYGVELITKYIINPNLSQLSVSGGLWVWCFVVKKPEIDAYCEAIKSQPSLQWIHLLNGSCLGDEGARKLCDSLTIHCSVFKIELEGCEIGSKGLKSIASMLNINKNVLHIDIRKKLLFTRRHFGIFI